MAVPRIKTFANAGTVLPTDLNAIQDDYASRLDALYVAGGFNADSLVRRGKSIISTTGTRSSTAYGFLNDANDHVQVVLPTDGLIIVRYQATWQEAVAGAARAAIFIGANQLKAGAAGQAAPILSEANISTAGAVNNDVLLASSGIGLASLQGAVFSGAYTGDVTTGQAIGGGYGGGITPTVPLVWGACEIKATAGTYDVSVQYKASSGAVTAKNRVLLVEVKGFS